MRITKQLQSKILQLNVAGKTFNIKTNSNGIATQNIHANQR
ncbi:hypothetical protein [Methanosphaera sp. BMS]|nr:hypothetical protein [Methanosphaera sp. BMS]